MAGHPSREALEAAAHNIVQRNTEKLLEVGLDESKVGMQTDASVSCLSGTE